MKILFVGPFENPSFKLMVVTEQFFPIFSAKQIIIIFSFYLFELQESVRGAILWANVKRLPWPAFGDAKILLSGGIKKNFFRFYLEI